MDVVCCGTLKGGEKKKKKHPITPPVHITKKDADSKRWSNTLMQVQAAGGVICHLQLPFTCFLCKPVPFGGVTFCNNTVYELTCCQMESK